MRTQTTIEANAHSNSTEYISMEQRLWIDSNLSKFDEVLRFNFDNTIERFAENITEHICKLLKAVHGAFFIIEQKTIKAISGYACTVDSMETKEFKIGEGIIGQVAKSKETLIFPNLQTQVNSSLGRVTASCLTVVPLIFNQEVYGIIEITTLEQLQYTEQELLERICRNIASFLQSFISNKQTKLLLEASQQQTEELRAQEEELRQSMEELQAIQEESERKNAELSGMLNAINNTLASIEFDMKGRINHANDRFLKVMGYKLEEVLGKHHSIFVEPDYAKSQEYKEFWENLNQSISQTNSEFRRVAKNGNEVWLSATYTPVLDSSGNPFKVVKLALDNTQAKKKMLDFKFQIEAIHKSFAVIEFDLNSNILSANDNFLKAMGYDAHEVIGKPHKIFVKPELQDEKYKQLWDNLRKGQFQSGIFERVTKEGKKILINGSYNPIFDTKGNITKIIKYVSVVKENIS